MFNGISLAWMCTTGPELSIRAGEWITRELFDSRGYTEVVWKSMALRCRPIPVARQANPPPVLIDSTVYRHHTLYIGTSSSYRPKGFLAVCSFVSPAPPDSPDPPDPPPVAPLTVFPAPLVVSLTVLVNPVVVSPRVLPRPPTFDTLVAWSRFMGGDVQNIPPLPTVSVTPPTALPKVPATPPRKPC